MYVMNTGASGILKYDERIPFISQVTSLEKSYKFRYNTKHDIYFDQYLKVFWAIFEINSSIKKTKKNEKAE